ncbi:putative membrane protein [Rubidibacter lacunae KORDI 51-2]|uniref:Putative membrane protein n=1 Tax=Rubidibacter lacunae KORDI 51-2 TaxID=582515 RepID=U5D9F7_9CHRO|nr:carotenoid biosynthesis protein [Rubidibacter lacunae]ERN41223.1 putative membrane protein [Rubidibacter lacunae KORDI 51-2]
MSVLRSTERVMLGGHLLAMLFGLAGLILVLPNQAFITSLPPVGQSALSWSMAGGGVVYMLMGAAAVFLYACRTLGLWHCAGFLVPAVALSLGSELLGTSTGFPFGDYRYLSGLGYKIAGLVPFTIPLSWFYVGFAAYLLARAALSARGVCGWRQVAGAIAIGSLLLTAWDLVLDPAMSQTAVPFWVWDRPGAFFGMPYQNFLGWAGTGALFMLVSSLLWLKKPVRFPYDQLGLPLAIYLGNLLFGIALSLAAGLWQPVLLSTVLALIPAIALYLLASSPGSDLPNDSGTSMLSVASMGVLHK